MATMLCFVVIATIFTCASVRACPTIVSADTTPLGCPADTAAYTEFKKSLYQLSQADANLCLKGQAVADYNTWYNTPGCEPLVEAEYRVKMKQFQNAVDYMTLSYQNYLNALANYQASLNCPNPAAGDDIVISKCCME